ncbi:capsular biosynthesis protein [Sphingomonas oleivorans]|uniref:Capsular biosynthesis protein n=1 Tax=Sphingomonas oleivorans TaxID=1735121 RepID=A0A2T5FX26_9SPHN|nr:capsular biosynthesis protein [Sphingomonas oleivorans]PTQ10699.1 capsular biosynthesis protein [Sphingomonas oleivorans]
MKYQPRLRRNYLFLQGPHGSFFPKLGAALVGAGHRTCRINFNGGDRATWPDGISYHGREKHWEAFIKAFFRREGVTDLVLFGDGRPKHAVAIAAARRAGIRVHVFEEGYIRPDWVTLERDGVNGHSSLPSDPDWYLAEARRLPPVPVHPPLPSYSSVRGWAAFFYYAEVVLQFWRFPFHQTHRAHDPVGEGVSWLRRFAVRKGEYTRAAETLRNLEGADYVLFPLQLDSDYQIRLHSPFANIRAAIARVIESFAAHAPASLRLAIKEHPLDSGLINWRRVVDEEAARFGVADRVDFLEHGDVIALVRNSRGLVTVNSTTGTLALAENVPVVVLGSAIYNIRGITHQTGLDSFWRTPQPPVPEIYDAFYRVLVERCLLHGAFLSESGIELLIEGAVRSLTREGVDAAMLVQGP